MMLPIRVLVVAENPLARTGLAALLANRPDCTVVGQVPADHNLMPMLDVYHPDVAIWDISADGLEYVSDVTAAGVGVLALVREAADAPELWSAGVSALLPQQTDSDQLMTALLAVEQKLIVVDPTLAKAIFSRERPPAAPAVETLTPRESEVLQLLSQGMANKTIAQTLGISEHTVKFHVNAIMTKLGAQSRTEAVVRATQQGLIIL